MRKAPWPARLLSIILLTLAVSFPAQIMLLYGHNFGELNLVFDKLTYFNWLCMIAYVASAVALWDLHRISLVFLPIAAIATAWNNFLVGYVGYDYSLASTFAATGFFMVSYSLLLHKDVIQIFKNPNLRWWTHAQRKSVALPTEVASIEGMGFASKTFDLSETGVFIAFANNNVYKDFAVGDFCNISIQVSDYKKIRCLAKVVRQTEGAGQYPKGLGLHFEDISSTDSRHIRRLLDESPTVTH